MRAGDRDPKVSRGGKYPLVIADKHGEILTQALRRREMDRIKAAQMLDGKARCGVEQRVIHPHELNAFDHLARTGGRGGTVVPDRADYFDAGERT